MSNKENQSELGVEEMKCGRVVMTFIAREGSFFPCALPIGHQGGCRAAGDCFKHGSYLGIEWQVPRCPNWPSCAELPSPPVERTQDEPKSPPRCRNCGQFKAMHEGWRWCVGEPWEKRQNFFIPDEDPEAKAAAGSEEPKCPYCMCPITMQEVGFIHTSARDAVRCDGSYSEAAPVAPPYPSRDVGTCADYSNPHCKDSHSNCDMWTPLHPVASQAPPPTPRDFVHTPLAEPFIREIAKALSLKVEAVTKHVRVDDDSLRCMYAQHLVLMLLRIDQLETRVRELESEIEESLEYRQKEQERWDARMDEIERRPRPIMTVPKQAQEDVLPPLDVTMEELALARTEDRSLATAQYYAQTKCRERQLLEALTRARKAEEERDRMVAAINWANGCGTSGFDPTDTLSRGAY